MNVRYAKDGAIATLTLDRPDRLNAMADPMWDALHGHLATIVADDAVRAVILTGAGRAFCSGGDVTGMAKSDTVSGRARSQRRHRAILALYNLEKPVIAAVRGAVYGIGNALALACDIVLASDSTKFSMAFKKVGVVPDAKLETEARALAADMASSATYALALAKKMFHSMYVPTLEQLLEMETLASGAARLTHDHQEGVAAFKEKRPPRFEGR